MNLPAFLPVAHACERNDVHSRLNPTRHARVLQPADAGGVVACLDAAQRQRRHIAIAGAQHAMGGQQFAQGEWLLDTCRMTGVLDFDAGRGLIRVAAGTRWPYLKQFLDKQSPDAAGSRWAIRQKQTGADDFSLGGALAANIHGRGLDRPPFVNDIERFTLVDPQGRIHDIDRHSDPERFALAIGGYGLFGVVSDLTLRLEPRRVLQRRVCLLRRAELAAAFSQARNDGARFGDFQFAIDPRSPDYLDLGVFACYLPLSRDTAPPAALHLETSDWQDLLHLAHTDKSEAFRRYSQFYLSSDGQHYGSDDHQFGVYLDGYHEHIDRCLGHVGSELITELYVPLTALDAMLATLAEDCRRHDVDVIYGTVRLIRQDRETVLAWARQDWACIVLNLHVRHDADGQRRAREDMQRLIDHALSFGGSFYLTYHRHARADQLRAAYPRIDAFLAAKQVHDPDGLLVSDWYRHLAGTLA